MLQLTLEKGYSFTFMFAVLGAAIVLVGLFYYRKFGDLRRGQWQTLFLLRVVAIVIVVLLLFRPVFSYYKELQQKPGLIFLLDTSSSMSIADDSTGVTRFNQARTQVQQWWERLQGDFDLRVVEFSEHARALDDVSQLGALAPQGQATSLSRALVAGAKLMPRPKVEAIILLSDGIHNSARSPLEVAMNMGIPVHTIGVGASLRSDVSYRDVQLVGLDCPDRMLLNNKVKIKALVEGVGLAGRVVNVVLEEDGQVLDQRELTLDDLEGAQEVEFEFRPAVKGRRTYTVKIPAVPEEKIDQNNQRSAVAMVVEPGIRVLYVEGTLRAEYGALVDRFLAKDPDLEFCALVQTRPNVFLKRSNIEGLDIQGIPKDAETINQFDVFLIGDLDSTYFRAEQQEAILKRVREGAGLVMLGGYHSLGPGGYEGTPLGDILPVLLGGRDIGQVTDPFLPTLTPEGAHHPIFANIAGFFPTKGAEPKQAGLPELDGCTRVRGARPGASVLATCSVEGTDMPVLAIQPVEKGRSAVFTGDTTRKWQQGPRALDQETPFLRFWGQLVRWAAGRTGAVEAAAGITASTDKGYYEPEEPVRISAVVRDPQGEGTDAAKVEARIRGPAGRPDKVTLTTIPGPGGHYVGTYEPKVNGPYEIHVEAKLGQLILTSEKLSIEVGRPNLEYEKLDMDEKMLARIAADTGGRYLHISTANHLIDQLNRAQRKKRIYLEKPLFWPPGFWAVFVTVVTVEWFLRRRFQLR